MAIAFNEHRSTLDHFHHSAHELKPTTAVELVWHANKPDLLRCGNEMRALAGRFVSRENDVAPERLTRAQRLVRGLDFFSELRNGVPLDGAHPSEQGDSIVGSCDGSSDP